MAERAKQVLTENCDNGWKVEEQGSYGSAIKKTVCTEAPQALEVIYSGMCSDITPQDLIKIGKYFMELGLNLVSRKPEQVESEKETVLNDLN
jgi:hypothetical protein